jgi:hypothetical protein
LVIATEDALMSCSTICSRIISSMAANPGTSWPVTVHRCWAEADAAIMMVVQVIVMDFRISCMTILLGFECGSPKRSMLDENLRAG